MDKLPTDIPFIKIDASCNKWLIEEVSVFGSILRDDFDIAKNDIDELVEFLPCANWEF